MTSTKNFDDLLKAAKLPERTVELCMHGDLQAEVEELLRRLRDAERERVAADSLDDGEKVAALREQIEDVRRQMVEHTYTFRLRALSRRAYQQLVEAHPPRRSEEDDSKPHELDAETGWNAATFPHALVRACLIDPELDDEQWTALYDEKLTDFQAQELQGAAWLLNRRRVDVPFLPAALRPTGGSDAE